MRTQEGVDFVKHDGELRRFCVEFPSAFLPEPSCAYAELVDALFRVLTLGARIERSYLYALYVRERAVEQNPSGRNFGSDATQSPGPPSRRFAYGLQDFGHMAGHLDLAPHA